MADGQSDWCRAFPPEPERERRFNREDYGPLHMPRRNSAPVTYLYLIFSLDLMKEFVRRTNRLQIIRAEENRIRRPRIFRDRLNPLDYLDDREVVDRYRLPRQMLYELVDLVREDVERPTLKSHCIPAVIQVLVTVRCLAKGNFYSEAADLHGIFKSSVFVAADAVLTSICERMDNIKFPTSDQDIRNTKRQFYTLANMPNVVGAIDGTLIKIIAPHENEPGYVCRKGFHAFNVQAIADASLRFTDMVCKWPGAVHDAFIFQNSTISEIFRNAYNGWLLGDSGYPLKPHLMTPVSVPRTDADRKYNSSHCRTRIVIERAFGVLKSRFRCLHPTGGALSFSTKKSVKAIVACFKLHNRCIDSGVPMPNVDMPDDNGQENVHDLQNVAGQRVRQQLIQRFA